MCHKDKDTSVQRSLKGVCMVLGHCILQGVKAGFALLLGTEDRDLCSPATMSPMGPRVSVMIWPGPDSAPLPPIPGLGLPCTPTLMEALMRPPLLCTFSIRSKS